MTGPTRPPRRLVHLLATACVSLLAATACDGAPGPRPAAREPVQLPLAERLPAADVQPAAEHIAFLSDVEHGLLRSGWHDASPREAEGQRWTRQRAGSLDVPVVAPAPLALTLDVTPVQQLLRNASDTEPQRLRILWNGAALADQELATAGDRLELRIPSEQQRVGLNQLDLLSSYWVTPRVHRLSWDNRVLGVRIDALELRSDAPQVAPTSPLARREGEEIVQRAGSLVTFGLRLPDAPRLIGSLALRGGAPAGGRALVSVTDRSGEAHVLLDRALSEVAGGPGAAVEADLSELAGPFVALNLAYSLGGDASAQAPPELVWRSLRIEGERAAPTAPEPRIPRGPYNVIVLLPDSLRADHLDLEDTEATPNARRLAARGVRFLNMRSNSTWTRPAVASMFTSLAPVSHGILGLDDTLDPSLAYLPQLLKRRGYHTFAILNSPVVSVPFRMGRGYHKVYTYYELREERRAAPDFGPASEVDHVWREFVARELAKAGDRPFFLFLHEIDPHSPYEPPEPYLEQHATGLRANFNFSGAWRLDPNHYDPGELAYLHALYRGEVAYTDDYLGHLLDVLDEQGLAERTLVVLISDHGEEFYEHRGLGHGKTVFEEQLRVPFIMSLPGVLPEGARVTVEAQTIDVAPTLLDLLGAEIPAAMQGHSLLPWLEGAEAAPDRPIIAHSMNRERESLQRGRWKLVRNNPLDTERGGPQFALFDLERDPGEITDLWQREPVIGLALRQELEHEIQLQAAATGRRAEFEAEPIAPELMEALKALGYGRD